VLLALETDADGRFAGRLRTAELAGPLRVTATAPELAAPEAPSIDALRDLGYGGGPATAPDVESIPMPAADVEVAPDDAEKLETLVLELGPRLPISGTLLGRDGAPVPLGAGGSRIWAVPSGTAYHGHGVTARAHPDAPGRFELPGLAPGRHDLCVSEELECFYSFENFLHRYRDVEAGTRGLELRLPERRETRITVRFAGAAPERRIYPSSGCVPRRRGSSASRSARRRSGSQGRRGPP
jgi:hypothetical protein